MLVTVAKLKERKSIFGGEYKLTVGYLNVNDKVGGIHVHFLH